VKRKREEEAKDDKKRRREEASKAKTRERQIRQNKSRKRKRVDANAEKENAVSTQTCRHPTNSLLLRCMLNFFSIMHGASLCFQYYSQEHITGLLSSTTSGREKAGDETMSSKVVKSSKLRTTNEAPTHCISSMMLLHDA
jgi:hypothetical protein